MDKSELVSMITISINKSLDNENPLYSLITIKDCYYGSQNDIRVIGKEVLENLMINDNDPNFDKMVSDYYFVFEYKNHYIIINYVCDIWEMATYQVIVVKTRREALIHRYGDY